MSLGSIVQDKAAMRLEDAMDFRGNVHEKAGVPIALIPFSVPILGLAVIGRRGHDQIDGRIPHLAQNLQTVADDELAKVGLKERIPLRRRCWELHVIDSRLPLPSNSRRLLPRK